MSTYQNIYGQFIKGYYGSCALGILVQSCIGGITAMAILQNGTSLLQMIQLFLVVIACIAFNGSIISVQKPKTVFNLLLFGVVLCSIISVVNVFVLR